VASRDAEPVVVLRDANPVTVLTVGERDLKKRGGWTIFFDRVDRRPSESGQLNLKLQSANAASSSWIDWRARRSRGSCASRFTPGAT